MTQRKTIQSRKNQRGITLLEVSIGLIIAAVVAAAAFLAFQANQRRAQVRENSTLLTQQLAELRTKFGQTTGYVGLTSTAAQSAGIATATSSYGGQIRFCGAGAGATAAQAVACTGTALTTPAPSTTALTANQAVAVWEDVPQNQALDLVLASLDGAANIYATAAGATPGTPVTLSTNGTYSGTALPAGAVDLFWVVNTR